ncbi:MAG: phospho-N-acetylmuramoyl-pentapeptide-transferase [Clostridia bacterium]|nr:phospho-N-acetylmuramoyl-pentapeptide-transferase [Clostridia bacterium]
MKIFFIATLVSLLFTVILGKLTIPILKRIKAGQTILHYVETHKNKNGTPTMGGLFFIISAIITFYLMGGRGRLALVACCIGLAFMLVGFIDDFIKIKHKKNEGLKPYQKILFQLSISLIAGFFAYVNKITIFYLPFSKNVVDLGVFTIPLVALIFIAITNSVNLTDGLDGLASGVSCIYLIFISIIISLQTSLFTSIVNLNEEYVNLVLLSSSLVGGILGFLIFNVSKASVFMGDTGSLSLGGFLGSISIFSSNSLFIPILGIMFVISSISVIVQVLYYKKTKKRIILMAPIHHHFQLKGYSESKISFIYSLITGVMGTLAILSYI